MVRCRVTLISTIPRYAATVGAPRVRQDICAAVERDRCVDVVLDEKFVEDASGHCVEAVVWRALIVREVAVDVHALTWNLPIELLRHALASTIAQLFFTLIELIARRIRHRGQDDLKTIKQCVESGLGHRLAV